MILNSRNLDFSGLENNCIQVTIFVESLDVFEDEPVGMTVIFDSEPVK